MPNAEVIPAGTYNVRLIQNPETEEPSFGVVPGTPGAEVAGLAVQEAMNTKADEGRLTSSDTWAIRSTMGMLRRASYNALNDSSQPRDEVVLQGPTAAAFAEGLGALSMGVVDREKQLEAFPPDRRPPYALALSHDQETARMAGAIQGELLDQARRLTEHQRAAPYSRPNPS
jgi:hypothetical protein